MIGEDVSGVWRSVRCQRVQKEPYYLGTEENIVYKNILYNRNLIGRVELAYCYQVNSKSSCRQTPDGYSCLSGKQSDFKTEPYDGCSRSEDQYLGMRLSARSSPGGSLDVEGNVRCRSSPPNSKQLLQCNAISQFAYPIHATKIP
jgi:hypothetical protein